jgi:hypothetical protein
MLAIIFFDAARIIAPRVILTLQGANRRPSDPPMANKNQGEGPHRHVFLR